jgi:hypothetical protein
VSYHRAVFSHAPVEGSTVLTRGSRTLAFAAAATILTILLAPAAGAQAADMLPDLVAPEPTSPAISVSTLADGQDHLLVRFDGYIHNVGAGPLEIRGSNPVNGVMTTTGQRIYQTGGGFRDDTSRHPQIYFENNDAHNHWHLKNAARFSLWNESGTAEVATGAKVGFCLQDVDHIDAFGPSNRVYSSAATAYCEQNSPGASSVYEGISRGWEDVYAAKLPFQWVDLSNVVPGRYRIGESVDPDNFVIESNEADNGPTLAPDVITVPGYLAASGAVTAAHAQPILLGAVPYGSPGPYEFRIEAAPGHGTLNAPAGASLGGNQVVYAPTPGFAGADSFTFSVRDTSTPFPVHPSVGVVKVTVPAPLVPLKTLQLLAKVRFSRHGRFLVVRAQAKQTGLLKVQVKKRKRRLGSCRKQAQSGHRFRCRIRLRKHASPRRAKVVVSLLMNGATTAVNTFRVPRRLHRTQGNKAGH